MRPKKKIPALLLAFALAYPTAAALVYFVFLGSHPLAAPAYFFFKVIQFCLPLLVLGRLRRMCPAERWTARRSLVWGLGSGVLLSLPILAAYLFSLRGTAVADAVAAAVAAKMTDFGIEEPLSYAAMALFLSLLHSGLEEIYWRWFVLGGLRGHLPAVPSIVVSSIGFMSHHVVILVTFLVPGPGAVLVIPAALAVAGAGAVWALLALRGGRLLGPWISHVVADLAIMELGWALLWA